MARARNIKPGFFSNEELVELSFSTRLLFIGLWTIADREGRLEDRPKRIKMAIFPADDVDVDKALNELHDSGFILRYECDAGRFIQVVAFTKHQNPHKAEKDSTIPAPFQTEASTVQAPCKNDGNRADSLIPDSLIPDSLNPDPGVRTTPERPDKTAAASDVFAYWQKVMDHPQAKLDKKRKAAITARLGNGYTVEQICTAIDGCKKSEYHQGKNDSNAVYDDIELICRNATNVDKFIKRAGATDEIGMSRATRTTVNNLQKFTGQDYRKGLAPDGSF
jgi:hypothetical protein